MNAAIPRWGWLATILLGLVVFAVFIGSQTAFALAYISGTMGNIPADRIAAELEKLASNGDVTSVGTFLSTPAGLLALAAVIMAKSGASFEDTLAMRVPRATVLARWLLAAAALAAATDAVTWMLGMPIVPPSIQLMYQSTESKGALWLSLLVAAPVFEEVFFRGFLITGLAASRLGASGAVIVTALPWAALHSQYDLYGIGTIFVAGLLLGAARVMTGSVLVPICMHALSNAIATAEAALL